MKPCATLYEYSTLEEAIRVTGLPWLAEWGREAICATQPTICLLPDRVCVMVMKRLAAEAGLALAGIHFVTPREMDFRLDQWLDEQSAPDPPGRLEVAEEAGLELLLARVAAEFDEGTARSVAGSPTAAFRLLERWCAAGHDPDTLPMEPLRKIATAWVARLESLGLTTPAQRHRHRLRLALDGAGSQAFHAVWMAGFGAEAWEHWPMLAVVARLAATATVALPRASDQREERLWLGTWEEWLETAAEPIGGGDQVGFPAMRFFAARAPGLLAAGLREAMEERGREAGEHRLRVGVADGGDGGTARELGALLAAEGVPHADGLGHLMPGERMEPGWPLYLAWERERELTDWFALVRGIPALLAQVPGGLEGIERVAAAAEASGFGALLWVAEWMVQERELSGNAEVRGCGEWLRAWPLLPEEGLLGDMVETVQVFCKLAGWEETASVVQAAAGGCLHGLTVSRPHFLRWLDQVASSWQVVRHPPGDQPFAAIELLRPGQVELREWDLLILTGLAEGAWPADLQETPFLGDQVMEEWNRRVTQQQMQRIAEGRHGAGHEVVVPGYGWLLTEPARRQLEMRRMEELPGAMEIWYATTLAESLEPEVPLEPGAYYLAAYERATGEVLDGKGLENVRSKTEQLGRRRMARRTPLEVKQDQIRKAYDARRDRHRGFGIYDCGMQGRWEPPKDWSASHWESVLTTPGAAWFTDGLRLRRVDPLFAEGVRTAKVAGSWMHQFAALAFADGEQGDRHVNRPLPLPSMPQALTRLREGVESFRARAAVVAQRLGELLPMEWELFCRETAHAAGVGVSAVLEWAVGEGCEGVLVEWWLPAECAVLVDDGERDDRMQVRGKCDLVLVSHGDPLVPGGEGRLVVIDYKRRKDFQKSDQLPGGLQLWLYREGLLGGGFGGLVEVWMVLRNGSMKAMPEALGGVEPERLRRALWDYAQSGIFGMREPVSADRGIQPVLPVTTLPIGHAILERRWALTFPGLTAASKLRTEGAGVPVTGGKGAVR